MSRMSKRWSVASTAALAALMGHEGSVDAQERPIAQERPTAQGRTDSQDSVDSEGRLDTYPITPEVSGKRYHQGLFLRGSLGLGPSWLTESTSVGNVDSDTLKARGLTGAFELLLGGTPARGLVLGGGVTAHALVDPTVETPGATFDTSDTSISLMTLTTFANYYPAPTEGLYVQALVGYGFLGLTVDGREQDVGDIHGFVFGGGVGYDFWVADQWSLGPAFRLTYAALGASEGDISVRERWLIPTVSFSVTYH
jgi:hypothetical protein